MAKQLIESRSEIEAVLKRAQVGTLAMVQPDGAPYLVPVNYVFLTEQEYAGVLDGEPDPGLAGRIIFHCALAGKKIDCIRHEPRVCFNAYTGVRMAYTGDKACDCSCRYESVVCFGTAHVIENLGDRIALLTALSAHYMQREIEPPGEARSAKTGVVEIRITEITGKRNVDPPKD